MPEIIQVLGLPFLACILMGLILGYFGTHVLKREVIFIDIALAQIAAVGSIVAHIAFDVHGDSLTVYLCSFGCVLIAAAFYACVRGRIFQISLEAIIGISYAIAAAAALFLVGVAPGGHIHVQHMLSGSVLWTNWRQIITCFIVFTAIGLCLYCVRKSVTGISNNYQQNPDKKDGLIFWDFIFYLLLGIVIVLSVRISGVVLVFAYLIIPATISAGLNAKLPIRLVVIWTAAITASFGGLIFAYFLDFSIGPTIALFLGVELIIAALINVLRHVYN
ncbi:MAG: metal ABC transporter permease [Sedimentisphaerales bacterium]|nr:metal ABC transporter permease [Sedimentisphaerales bacterium]